jgi:hypothetical protein
MSEPIGFPTLQEYRTALLNPKDAFVWSRLKGAIPQRSGLAFFWGQGRFAVVSKITLQGDEWALRLPLSKQAGADERYTAIAQEVANGNTLFVPVEYSTEGIAAPVGTSQIRPVVLMKWVSGLAVRDFVIQACENNDVQALLLLKDAFVNLANELQKWGVVHGDLSPDNILVDDQADPPRLQLVDYDSVQILHIGPLPTSVGLTPMRHPKGPVQPDASSDLFPLHIYISVLTALANNPKLGTSPDNYDQKFLVDAPILAQGTENLIVRELFDSAPEEIGNLIDLLNAPYEQTPLIMKPMTDAGQSNPVVLSSDWMELLHHVGEIVEVRGFIKRIMPNNEITLTNPSKISNGITVMVKQRRTLDPPLQLWNYICVIGKVSVDQKQINIDASSIQVENFLVKLGSENNTLTEIRTRISDAIKRIRDRRIP